MGILNKMAVFSIFAFKKTPFFKLQFSLKKTLLRGKAPEFISLQYKKSLIKTLFVQLIEKGKKANIYT